jgi:cell division protein FtsL
MELQSNKPNEGRKALTEKVFIVLLSTTLSIMVALGVAFITMQKNIVELQVEQKNIMRELEGHISGDSILKPSDVMATVWGSDKSRVK